MKQCLIVVMLAAAMLLAGFTQGGATASQAKPVTVFLLRHAERVVDGKNQNDPKLNEKGQRRARALGRLLRSAGVTHLFATQYVRSRSTLAPLADNVSLEVQIISAGSRPDQVAALHGLPPGSVAVVAGHSNTVPLMVRGLGGEVGGLTDSGHLDDDAYDRLFVVTLPVGDASTQTIELRYGEQDQAGR